MKLPEYVLRCIRALEEAGFEAWAVGGCVRDSLLGREPQDYDLCSNASPEAVQQVFGAYPQVTAGLKHGTVGVIADAQVVQITTYRTEGAYSDGRHPDRVEFVTALEEDLRRRDFTVNAMAWSPKRGLADPFGGRSDLEKGLLRAVGEPERRFREDALRILRGVRFSVRYGFEVEETTFAAMCSLAPLLDRLSRERVFSELNGLLPGISAGELIKYAPILTRAIPELEPMVGFDQRSPHHKYDLYTHTAYVTASVPGEKVLRWAALLHDVGKIQAFTLDETGRGHFYGHAQLSAQTAEAVLRRLKAPTALREQVVTIIDQHMTRLLPDKKFLRRCLRVLGPEQLDRLLALQRADMGSKGVRGEEEGELFDRVQALLEELRQEGSCITLRDLAVDGNDLTALGLGGRQIGRMLEQLLEMVTDDRLENEKQALLRYAAQELKTVEDFL